MAINKNHEFEDLNGVKCSIVEKNISEERMNFLNDLLTLNKYTVVIATNAAPASAEGEEPKPSTYTVGVTDLSFNPTNAIFSRLLKSSDGHIITLSYWKQESLVSDDSIPYFGKV
jgi:hypothetical protein